MEFKATNHLRAEADEGWIALVMGNWFHNSNRCDLPTRTLRIYFAHFDNYELREGTTDQGHVVNLSGFDGSRYCEPQGWNRFSNAYYIGYQVRDLQSFVWRAEYRKHRFEIRAQRIDNNRWTVEYCSNCENSEHRFEMVEYRDLLKDWFQMIDPDTFEITTATTTIGDGCSAVPHVHEPEGPSPFFVRRRCTAPRPTCLISYGYLVSTPCDCVNQVARSARFAESHYSLEHIETQRLPSTAFRRGVIAGSWAGSC